jgi:hypothetical protein
VLSGVNRPASADDVARGDAPAGLRQQHWIGAAEHRGEHTRACRTSHGHRHSAIASVVPESDVLWVRSDRVAGPETTEPVVVNCDPWHGQT